MAWPTSLRVGLKEWSVVCHALEQGRQILLLRKGGISEVGGEFEVEQREFLLFPTHLHQNKQMLKPDAHDSYQPLGDEPAEVTLSAAGVVTDIIQLQSRSFAPPTDPAAHVRRRPGCRGRFDRFRLEQRWRPHLVVDDRRPPRLIPPRGRAGR